MLLISAIVIVEVEVQVCFPINSDRDHESAQRRRCQPSRHAQEVLRTEPARIIQELDRTDPGKHECQLSYTVTKYHPCDTLSHVCANDTDASEQGMGLAVRRVRPITAASGSPGTVRKRYRLYSRLSPKTDRHHDIPTERPRGVRISYLLSGWGS